MQQRATRLRTTAYTYIPTATIYSASKPPLPSQTITYHEYTSTHAQGTGPRGGGTFSALALHKKGLECVQHCAARLRKRSAPTA